MIEFKCPHCGSETVEAVMVNVTVASTVEFDSTGDAFYTDNYLEDGTFCRFQCKRCGHELPIEHQGLGYELDELTEWLKKQPYNVEKHLEEL